MRLPSYGSTPSTNAPLPGPGVEVGSAADITKNDGYLLYYYDIVKAGIRNIRLTLNPVRELLVCLLLSGKYSRKRSLLVDRLLKTIEEVQR